MIMFWKCYGSWPVGTYEWRWCRGPIEWEIETETPTPSHHPQYTLSRKVERQKDGLIQIYPPRVMTNKLVFSFRSQKSPLRIWDWIYKGMLKFEIYTTKFIWKNLDLTINMTCFLRLMLSLKSSCNPKHKEMLEEN